MKLLNQIQRSNEDSVGIADTDGNEIFVGDKLSAIIDVDTNAIQFKKLPSETKSFLTWNKNGANLELLLDVTTYYDENLPQN